MRYESEEVSLKKIESHRAPKAKALALRVLAGLKRHRLAYDRVVRVEDEYGDLVFYLRSDELMRNDGACVRYVEISCSKSGKLSFSFGDRSSLRNHRFIDVKHHRPRLRLKHALAIIGHLR